MTESAIIEDGFTVPLNHLNWHPWVPYHRAVVSAPAIEGIYMARQRKTQLTVYVGHAGRRQRYNGLSGRFRTYKGGNLTGLTENALRQALRKPEWIQAIAEDAAHGTFLTGADLVRRAMCDAELEITWTLCPGLEKNRLAALEAAVRAGIKNQEALWSQH